MKSLFIGSAALAASLSLLLPARAADPSRIDAYVTPYYNSSGPVVDAGEFSRGLASKSPQQFVSTIVEMKKQFATLNFVELYVGAIRLYDYGYRDEATYWFYSAQFRGRQFGALVDKGRMGASAIAPSSSTTRRRLSFHWRGRTLTAMRSATSIA